MHQIPVNFIHTADALVEEIRFDGGDVFLKIVDHTARLGKVGSCSCFKRYGFGNRTPLSIAMDDGSMEDEEPGVEQQNAVNYLLVHETAVHASVLLAVADYHSTMQHKHGKELVPDSNLEQLIEFASANINPVAKGGIAYIGFMFR